MGRLVAAVVTALLLSGTATSADATTYKLGGKCTKALQVRTIKGVRAQCTWIRLANPTPKRRGTLIWKALTPARTSVTREELVGSTPQPTPSASVDAPTPTPAPTATP